MTQPDVHRFQIGERVRVVVDLPMARVGEHGRITALYESKDCLRSLTVLIDHDPLTTRGITVWPHEIAVVEIEEQS